MQGHLHCSGKDTGEGGGGKTVNFDRVDSKTWNTPSIDISGVEHVYMYVAIGYTPQYLNEHYCLPDEVICCEH